MNDATAVSASTHVLVAVSLTAFTIFILSPTGATAAPWVRNWNCLGNRTHSIRCRAEHRNSAAEQGHPAHGCHNNGTTQTNRRRPAGCRYMHQGVQRAVQ